MSASGESGGGEPAHFAYITPTTRLRNFVLFFPLPVVTRSSFSLLRFSFRPDAISRRLSLSLFYSPSHSLSPSLSLFHCFPLSLFHCFSLSLFHCFTVSLSLSRRVSFIYYYFSTTRFSTKLPVPISFRAPPLSRALLLRQYVDPPSVASGPLYTIYDVRALIRFFTRALFAVVPIVRARIVRGRQNQKNRGTATL